LTAVAPSLSFGSVEFLAGLAAATLPIIIHLINRRRARVRSFAAVSFLLASNRRVAQKLKLRQLFLLLVAHAPHRLRAARAREAGLRGRRRRARRRTRPSAPRIVLDNSLSMA